MTQADFQGVQRNAIAQVEQGQADLRLSTLVALAEALGVPPFMMLLGAGEFRALASLVGEHDRVRQVAMAPRETTSGVAGDTRQPLHERELLASVARASREHVVVQREAEREDDLAQAQTHAFFKDDPMSVERRSPAATVGAAIGTLWLPGIGAAIGALLPLYETPAQEPSSLARPKSGRRNRNDA